jgi:hypothetical protein
MSCSRHGEVGSVGQQASLGRDAPDVRSGHSRPNWALGLTTALPHGDLIAPHREPMVAMLRRQPILDRLFVQEAGHVVDLAFWTVTLDMPTASGRLLSFKSYMSVYHRASLHRQ